MERRLLVAKRLLSPDASCLIVSIDEKEYLHLGMLLEQMFPEASMQMISSVINPKGTGRFNEFSRTNEYIYMLWFGDERVKPLKVTAAGKAPKVEWQTFRRRDLSSVRHTRPGQFYPIYVNEESGEMASVYLTHLA